MKTPRMIAYNLILEWETKQTYPNLTLIKALRPVQNERDRRFITALFYGVVEKKITLDYFLSKCSDRAVDRLSAEVRTALRMGLYQMFYMDIPPSAACNTSVDCIKKAGRAHSAGYVNAVLRRCAAEKDELLSFKKADYTARFSISPQIVDLLLEQYGKEKFLRIIEGISAVSTRIYLFLNSKKCSADQLIASLASENIAINKTDIENLFFSDHGFDVETSQAFKKGYFHVIGRHSAEAALLLPKNAEKIMDLCAAPGGKTFAMASLTEAEIFAYDLYPHKIELMKAAGERLGHQNIHFECSDATVFDEKQRESADFVLCDVPCSGLGIMGKKPDIKYKEYKDNPFIETQKKILENGFAYLREGGRLVYSTCTIDQRENEALIQEFVSHKFNCSLDPSFYNKGYITFLPQDGEDGFFIAVLKKG